MANCKCVVYRDLNRFTLNGITLKKAHTIIIENMKKKLFIYTNNSNTSIITILLIQAYSIVYFFIIINLSLNFIKIVNIEIIITFNMKII